ncbi:DNA polymerase epsilon subunit B [Vararia minispora EC-137]|uniref:DNA polymerase epsilon subunit B n=1 Tax=Vararia minispora EC-137 TaxID=1314806 RepID=A0ACB8QRM1_9AGAM|nr:DNA polymerase epsilon subunit B [Vararia minispora EC-137]
MSSPRQKIIIRVFRKYSHSLGPEEIAFLEEVLNEHDIADEDVEYSVELIAKEYNKQDDAAMKVALPILKRVYEVLQASGERPGVSDVYLDPDAHLWFVNAFEMPAWRWSHERGTFERISNVPSLTASAEARVAATRDRLNVIRQTILRNEHFTPSTVPTRDRQHLLTIRSTKQLLGRAGERFLLFGMLAHSKEGRLCLEDQDGIVELDFSQLDQPSEGLFTEGAFVLVEGDYTEDETFVVIAIGHPPCESRETARAIYGHVDFLGKGATTPLEDAQFAKRIQDEFSHMTFFFFSDVWLDHPDTLRGLRKIFDNCVENDYIPKVLVMCGNFSSRGVSQGSSRDVQRYQEGFDSLADLIGSYPLITARTHFVFVPGPTDLAANSILPRRPLLSFATTRLRSKIPHVHLSSNPCRIKFFGQEVVIFREDMMARMLRNLVGVKPDVRNDDLKRYSILDQSHLAPLTNNIQPVLADYDHSLRLYPLPTAVVLADKYESYRMTYEGCHVLNPGQFVGHSFQFSSYMPATRESEAWCAAVSLVDRLSPCLRSSQCCRHRF